MKGLSKEQVAAQKAAAGEVRKLAMIQAHQIVAGAKGKYTPLTKNREAFAAWIIASAMTANYFTLSDKGTVNKVKSGKSQPKLLRALIGATAWGHWHKLERIVTNDKGSAFPVKGKNEIQARLSGNSKGYNTTLATVRAFAAAQVKGATVTVGNDKYDVSSELAVVKNV